MGWDKHATTVYTFTNTLNRKRSKVSMAGMDDENASHSYIICVSKNCTYGLLHNRAEI